MRRGGGRAAAEGARGSRLCASIAGREVAGTAAAERGLGGVGWMFPRKLSQRPRRRDPQSAGRMARGGGGAVAVTRMGWRVLFPVAPRGIRTVLFNLAQVGGGGAAQ